MTIRLAQISDNIRISVLDGGLTVYFLPPLPDALAQKLMVYGDDGAALASGDKVIGGITLVESNGWYTVETLWSESAAGAVTLLYAALEHYKKILPSNMISPAAHAVVKRFYKKYKGTEVVVELAHPDPSIEGGELAAGYVWSTKLRKVPVKVGKVGDAADLLHLWQSVVTGFNVAYADPKKTKRDNLDDFLAKQDYNGLLDLIQRWYNTGNRDQAYIWIAENRAALEKIGNRYTSKILQYYYEGAGDE